MTAPRYVPNTGDLIWVDFDPTIRPNRYRRILTSHIRSFDTQARPVRYTGSAVPPEIAQLVRAKLSTFITI